MKLSTLYPSKYFKVEDLEGKRKLLTIASIEVESIGQESSEEKPVVYFRGAQKGLVLNRTNGAMISEIAGTDETDNWPGVAVVLAPARTQYQGKIVACIRIEMPQHRAPDAAKPAAAAAKPAEAPEREPGDDTEADLF